MDTLTVQSGVLCYFLDAVSPDLPALPDGWRDRLIKVERDGLRAWFLDPNDAALSKYARGEPRDRRWIQAGILAGVVSMPIVKSRIGSTSFFDTDEEQRARALVEEDEPGSSSSRTHVQAQRQEAEAAAIAGGPPLFTGAPQAHGDTRQVGAPAIQRINT